MVPTRSFTAMLVALSLAACAPGDLQTTEPAAAPALDVLADEAADVFELENVDRPAATGNGDNQSATGHGNLTVGGELRTFSFSAIRHPNREVTGQFQIKNRASDVVIHGEVTCLLVIPRPGGGAAFMGGVVTRVDGNAPGFFEGRPVIFNAFDNGEGANARFADFISLVAATTPQTVQRQCALGLRISPVLPVEAGNIQVRP